MNEQLNQNAITFSDAALLWKKGYLDKRNNTAFVVESYMAILKNRILPYIGDINMQELSTADLDNLLQAQIDKGYSSQTIRNTFGVVKSILAYAIKKGMISDNPAARMDDLPSVRREQKIHYFTPAECKEFLRFIENEDLVYRTFYTLSLYSGFRRGELCAMHWDDIDYERQTISIKRSLSQTKAGLIEKEPKTPSSERTITLPPCCFDLLLELQKSANCEYVFTRKGTTSPFWPQHMSRKFHCIIDRYNSAHSNKLPQIRLHDLRHTAATLLIAQNVDAETVARRLGHSNPAVTLNIYAHPTMEGDKRASDTLAALLS